MSWLTRIAEYEHEDASHDYDINWDYEPDDQVEEQIKQAVTQYTETLKTTLLPQLRIFRQFRVEFVYLSPGKIATYVNGTYSAPVVAVDVSNTKAACEEYGGDCMRAIKMSILHELGHAIQEAKGVSFDEDDAEEFARQHIID